MVEMQVEVLVSSRTTGFVSGFSSAPPDNPAILSCLSTSTLRCNRELETGNLKSTRTVGCILDWQTGYYAT